MPRIRLPRIVSETVKKAAQTAGILYERYERRNLQYNYEGIVHVKDVQEAISLLNELEGNIFLTTGVNTAAASVAGVKGGADQVFLFVYLIIFLLWKDVRKPDTKKTMFLGKCHHLLLKIM